MSRLRLHRLTTTFFVVLSLLFSQLALASYVCPLEADAEAMAAMVQAGQPCDGILGYDPETATAIMRNIVLYVVHNGRPPRPATAPAAPAAPAPSAAAPAAQ